MDRAISLSLSLSLSLSVYDQSQFVSTEKICKQETTAMTTMMTGMFKHKNEKFSTSWIDFPTFEFDESDCKCFKGFVESFQWPIP